MRQKGMTTAFPATREFELIVITSSPHRPVERGAAASIGSLGRVSILLSILFAAPASVEDETRVFRKSWLG